MIRILKLFILISLVSCMLIGCNGINNSNKTSTDDMNGHNNENRQNEENIENDNQVGNTNKEALRNDSKQELDISSCIVEDEQDLEPNRLLKEINSFTYTNSVNVTSHEFVNKTANNDVVVKDFDDKSLKHKDSSVKRVDNDIFDRYSNIISPRLVDDGIVFLVSDIEKKNIGYIIKQNFTDDKMKLIYTFCDTDLEGDDLSEVTIKTTDENIIYKFQDGVIVYNVENNKVVNHIKYDEIFYNVLDFDISSDGKTIAFIDKNYSLIISDIEITKPRIVMKRFTDKNDEMNGSRPGNPSFSTSNPDLLIFQLIGYEWSYGDMLYSVSKDSLDKLYTGQIQLDASAEWVGENLFALLGNYDSYIYGFNNNNKEYMTTKNQSQYNYNTDYGISNSVIGMPVYNDNNRLIFLDVIDKKVIDVDNIQPGEIYISISRDEKYLVAYCEGTSEYKLYVFDN